MRFAVPIAMSGVDDSGCCDATFWEELGDTPTLRAIAQRAVAWLEGSHLGPAAGEVKAASDGDADTQGAERTQSTEERAEREEREERAEARRRWESSERHWYGKHTVVTRYRSLARSAVLVASQPASPSPSPSPGLGPNPSPGPKTNLKPA